MRQNGGFTLLELLTVISIIAVLAAIILVSVNESRKKSRDANRASQVQEFLKALELYYTEFGAYPDDGIIDTGTAVQLRDIESELSSSGYLARIPEDPYFPPVSGYHYCASDDGDSMALIVNTEYDRGGTEYCAIGRGVDAYTICTINDPDLGVTNIQNIDRCTDRF